MCARNYILLRVGVAVLVHGTVNEKSSIFLLGNLDLKKLMGGSKMTVWCTHFLLRAVSPRALVGPRFWPCRLQTSFSYINPARPMCVINQGHRVGVLFETDSLASSVSGREIKLNICHAFLLKLPKASANPVHFETHSHILNSYIPLWCWQRRSGLSSTSRFLSIIPS